MRYLLFFSIVYLVFGIISGTLISFNLERLLPAVWLCVAAVMAIVQTGLERFIFALLLGGLLDLYLGWVFGPFAIGFLLLALVFSFLQDYIAKEHLQKKYLALVCLTAWLVVSLWVWVFSNFMSELNFSGVLPSRIFSRQLAYLVIFSLACIYPVQWCALPLYGRISRGKNHFLAH